MRPGLLPSSKAPVAVAAARAVVAVVSDKGAASALPFSCAPFATAQRYHARSLFASLVSTRSARRLAAMSLMMALMLASCTSIQRELSDAEWCQSLGHPEGSREYAECRAQIDRQRQHVARAGGRVEVNEVCHGVAPPALPTPQWHPSRSFRQDERLLGLRKLNATELARSFNHGLLNRESFCR
jgi:hypothetical protein